MKHEVISAEQEIRDGMRSFSTAQKLLPAGLSSDNGRAFSTVSTSWYGTDIDTRRGSFAYVQKNSRMEDVIGDIIEVRYRSVRVAFVYVLGAADLPYELHLSRRAFTALAVLSKENLRCVVRTWE